MSNLTGKTAFITGGSKGIGLGIAEALVKEGLNVTVTARSEEQVKQAADLLNAQGPGRALGLACDVRSLEQQEEAARRTAEEFGQIDVVIANAGVGGFGPVDELDPDTWNAVIDTNVTGVFYTLKATVAQLKKNRGYFMTVASLAGTNFFEGGSAYNASKFGVVGFTQAAMLDLRGHGVKTTTLMPGSVASHFNDNEPGEKDAWKIQPEDMGDMVVYLLRTPARTLPSKIEVRPSIPPQR